MKWKSNDVYESVLTSWLMHLAVQEKVIANERIRRQERLETIRRNDVWKYRTTPPNSFNRPLPEHMMRNAVPNMPDKSSTTSCTVSWRTLVILVVNNNWLYVTECVSVRTKDCLILLKPERLRRRRRQACYWLFHCLLACLMWWSWSCRWYTCNMSSCWSTTVPACPIGVNRLNKFTTRIFNDVMLRAN